MGLPEESKIKKYRFILALQMHIKSPARIAKSRVPYCFQRCSTMYWHSRQYQVMRVVGVARKVNSCHKWLEKSARKHHEIEMGCVNFARSGDGTGINSLEAKYSRRVGGCAAEASKQRT